MDIGRTTVNEGSMAFHWLSCDSFLLAEPRKNMKSFFLLLSFTIILGHENSLFWPPGSFN